MKREIETVKVTESVQKAQEQIVNHGAGAASTLNNAAAFLESDRSRSSERGIGPRRPHRRRDAGRRSGIGFRRPHRAFWVFVETVVLIRPPRQTRGRPKT